MFKSEEKATPRPRFLPRTWGTLRVFVSRENCAVVNPDQPLNYQSQDGPFRATRQVAEKLGLEFTLSEIAIEIQIPVPRSDLLFTCGGCET